MPQIEDQIPGILTVVVIMTTVLGVLWLVGPAT